MRTLVVIAGVGQLALALASLSIPRLLGWREQVAGLRPLTRQVFWTYAAYIWGTNVAFGLLSVIAPEWLLDAGPLGRAVSGFIGLYWSARLAVQFLYFDRTDAPSDPVFRLAEAGLVCLFAYLSAVYSWLAFLHR